MKKLYSLIAMGAMLASTLVPAAAFADSSAINFEAPTYTVGSINGQDGWSATGPYDQSVVNSASTTLPGSFGSQSFRLSNAVTSGSFGDQTFSKSLADSVGEASSTAGTYSVGTKGNHFEMQFDIASASSTVLQPGLVVSVSPDRGDGSRMSYLRFEDQADGIHVFFDDVQGTGAPANFVEADIATISRTAHTVKLTLDAVDGPSNDIVKVYIDGSLVKTGTSWENYYRFDPEASAEQSPRIVKDVLFRAGGTAAPATLGGGFLFDNLSLSATTLVAPASTITVNGENPTTAVLGSTYSDQGATAHDIGTGTTTQITGTGTVNTAAEGTYTVTYNYTDSQGHAAAPVTRTVTVVAAAGGGGGGGGGSSSSSGGSSSNTTTTTTGTGTSGVTTTTTTGQVLGASTFNFTRDLTIGSTGDDVIALQQILIAGGYGIPAGATGYFGTQTQAAVKLYQAAHGITATGYVGPLTRASLNIGSIPNGSREQALQALRDALPGILAMIQQIQAELQAMINAGTIK